MPRCRRIDRISFASITNMALSRRREPIHFARMIFGLLRNIHFSRPICAIQEGEYRPGKNHYGSIQIGLNANTDGH